MGRAVKASSTVRSSQEDRRTRPPDYRDGTFMTRLRPLVLIAEDFEDARELYRDYLEYSGFAVEAAANGREAIEMASRLQPDIILMDAGMPVLDGWQATRELKSSPATRHIPVIALTAHAFDDARQQAKVAACDGFLTKPSLPADLVEKVRETLGGAGKPNPRVRQ